MNAALATVRELSHVRPALIHGDLHAGNILCADREPWPAIDPKGMWESASPPNPSSPRRMIERALDTGVPAAWATGDEIYGNNPHLRTTLERRQLGYVLAVSSTDRVPTLGGLQRADHLAMKIPKQARPGRPSAPAGPPRPPDRRTRPLPLLLAPAVVVVHPRQARWTALVHLAPTPPSPRPPQLLPRQAALQP